MLRRVTLMLSTIATVLSAAGCFASRPPFRDAQWGGAPAPYPVEITEITSERRVCSDLCRFERYVIRRDGNAVHEYLTGARRDSVYYGRVDSTTFVNLASAVGRSLFAPSAGEVDHHVPLSNNTYLFSVATLCRRKTVATAQLTGEAGRYGQVIEAIVLASGLMNFRRCCGDVRAILR